MASTVLIKKLINSKLKFPSEISSVTNNLTKTRRIASAQKQNMLKNMKGQTQWEHLEIKQNIDSRCVCPSISKVIQGDDDRQKL